MRAMVTGANGYIGSRLVRMLLANGHSVVCATRRVTSEVVCGWQFFDLATPVAAEFTKGIDVLIHLAAQTQVRTDEEGRIDIAAAEALVEACYVNRTQLVFVSSQSAQQNAPSAYGRTKWKVEQVVSKWGGQSLRPGQVYGAVPAGLFGTLVAAVARLPVLPRFLPAPRVQPIHVDDLCRAICSLIGRAPITGPICVASDEPVKFDEFLAHIAQQRLRVKRAFIPVPMVLFRGLTVLLGDKLAARTGVSRLLSLSAIPTMKTKADLAALGVELRPLWVGMHGSGDGTRRALLREGKALLTYVLRHPPPPTMLRSFVRYIESADDSTPLLLPDSVLTFPSWLGVYDADFAPAQFRRRLDAATALAEASVVGFHRFLGGQVESPFRAVVCMGGAVFLDCWWRALRLLARPWGWGQLR